MEVATKVDGVMSVTFVAPTALDVVLKTKLSRSSSSGTSSKLQLFVISLKQVFMTDMLYQSFMPNLLTALVVQFTLKS